MDVVKEMRATRLAGRLVPFLGAGMSRPVCRGWQGMVESLLDAAGMPHEVQDPCRVGTDDLGLIRRAEKALDVLRNGHGRTTASGVRDALLEEGPSAPPPQTVALASADWPLVLTTNYDDLFLAAAHQSALRTRRLRRAAEEERRSTPYQLAGRSSSDCHRVLSSLSHPTPPLLWALQGFAGGQATVSAPLDDGSEATVLYQDWAWPRLVSGEVVHGVPAGLQDELVVGHADYRRVALRSEDFRRAFAEVFRNRSLLFLGSGLGDRYLLDLFGQIIELVGPSAHPHFAVALRGELDLDLLQRHFGIWVHEISSHTELPTIIDALASDPGAGPCATRWEVSVESPARPEVPDRLTITAGPLPSPPEPGTCVVISGGGSESGYLRTSRQSRQYLADAGVIPASAVRDRERVSSMFRLVPGRRFVWSLKDPRIDWLLLVARVRENPGSALGWQLRPTVPATSDGSSLTRPPRGRSWRDARLLAFALYEILDLAAEAECHQLLTTVLGAGSLRVNSPSSAILEMIRAWGACSLQAAPPLTIHVLDHAAQADLRAGRLDPSRALSAARGARPPRGLEYWLEIMERTGAVQRVLRVDDPRLPVTDVLRQYSIDRRFWRLRVWPAPCLGWGDWTTETIDRWESTLGQQLSLERFGVLLGSTLTAHEPGSRAG